MVADSNPSRERNTAIPRTQVKYCETTKQWKDSRTLPGSMYFVHTYADYLACEVLYSELANVYLRH